MQTIPMYGRMLVALLKGKPLVQSQILAPSSTLTIIPVVIGVKPPHCKT